jgi:ketosteroid isomerase-like protein
LKVSALVLALAATAAVARAESPASVPEAVAAAERAFAAEGMAKGVGPSFVNWAAPEGVVFRPDPVNARQFYTAHPGPGPGALNWWPHRVGVARSGDLAFDTGPWVSGDGKAHGWFFTVWKKQPDGTWKWMLDHGFSGGPSKITPETPLSKVPVSDHGAASAEKAYAQVKAEEGRLRAGLAAGHLAPAYGAVVSEHVWVAGLEDGPATTLEAVDAALAKRPQTMTLELLGGEASAAGDFAYTYGRASWNKDGKAVQGRFVRVWQKGEEGWRILFDETTPL